MGSQGFGGEADLLFGGLADAVEIDGIEAEGGADLLGLGGVGGEAGGELEGDCLAGLGGAGGLWSGFLSVLAGHLSDLSTKAAGSRARCPALPPRCGSTRLGTRRLRPMLLGAAE